MKKQKLPKSDRNVIMPKTSKVYIFGILNNYLRGYLVIYQIILDTTYK